MRKALLVVRRLLQVFVITSLPWLATATLRVKRNPAATAGKNDGILYCQLNLNVFLKPTTVSTELHFPTANISSGGETEQRTRHGHHHEEFVSCIPVGREESDAAKVQNVPVSSGMYSLDVPDWLIQQERSRLMNGQEAVIVAIPGASLTLDSVIVPDPSQIFVVSEPSRSLRSQRALGRKPASKGSLTVTTLRVSTLDSEPDHTREELYHLLYESEPSFRDQYIKCSSGQLIMEPSTYGVMDVQVNLTLATVTSVGALVNQAMIVADGMIGESNGILANTDLLIIDLPPGTGDWAAYATISGKQSIYNNNWAAFLGGTMHEVGHNLGLRHAFEHGAEYEDRTGYMGGMPEQTRYPVQCFNAQNHYVLGWFAERTYEFGIANPSKLLNVAAFIDYSVMLEEDKNNDSDEYVIVRIGDVYLQYNFAQDYNRETSAMKDKLAIVRVREYGTDLLAGLGVGDGLMTGVSFEDNESQEYQENDENLAVLIRVCGVYNSGRSQATNSDVMIVSVTIYDNDSDENDVASLCEQASVLT